MNLAPGKRVALVHDWLTGMRGGEKVLERLCGLFPGAPIHTLVWNRGSVSGAIESHPIRTSFLQGMPNAAQAYRWYLPLFPSAIEGFDLGEFDVVVSSSHAVAKGVRPREGAFHLSYVHTPMRYVWDLETQYFPPGRFPWPASAYVRATCARLRRWDRATNDRVHAILCNSAHVAERIRRHWGREARVVHPPADVARFRLPDAPGERDYYLLAGALAPYKRGDLAIEACRTLGRRLVVVGSGPMAATLRRGAGPGIEFRGWASDDELARLLHGARALLFPGEEDFGIVPVEAMASGCPVIAFGRGGALETVGRGAEPEALARVGRGGVAVVPGGVLFGEPNAPCLIAAIGQLEATRFEPAGLRARAGGFAPERFDREFSAAFAEAYASWGARGGAPAAS
jgi:glycosyltransferase involved in cell wall biosynthesis